MDLWATVARGRRRLLSPECLVQHVAALDNRNFLEHFNNCWHDFMDRLLGPFGSRHFGNSPVHFVDPQEVDFNYVLGPRSWENPPLIWHLAGRNKNLRDAPEDGGLTVMERFIQSDWDFQGLPDGAGLNFTALDCGPWEEAGATSTACHPGTDVVDCR